VIAECQKNAVYETLVVKIISKTVDLGILYQITTSINNNVINKYGVTSIERLTDEIYNTTDDSVCLNARIHSFVLTELNSKVIDMTKGRGSVQVVTDE
jgi:hypothetical protein